MTVFPFLDEMGGGVYLGRGDNGNPLGEGFVDDVPIDVFLGREKESVRCGEITERFGVRLIRQQEDVLKPAFVDDLLQCFF